MNDKLNELILQGLLHKICSRPYIILCISQTLLNTFQDHSQTSKLSIQKLNVSFVTLFQE